MQGLIVYKDNNSNNGPTSLPGKWEEAEASKLRPLEIGTNQRTPRLLPIEK